MAPRPGYDRTSTLTFYVSIAAAVDEYEIVRMTPDLAEAVEAALAVADRLGIGGATGARSVDVTLAGGLVLSVAVLDGGLLGR